MRLISLNHITYLFATVYGQAEVRYTPSTKIVSVTFPSKDCSTYNKRELVPKKKMTSLTYKDASKLIEQIILRESMSLPHDNTIKVPKPSQTFTNLHKHERE